MRGYSQNVVEANTSAEPNPGVQLGALCIARRISATVVAKKLNISRQTVYDWFSGRAKPSSIKILSINAYIDELNGEVSRESVVQFLGESGCCASWGAEQQRKQCSE